MTCCTTTTTATSSQPRGHGRPFRRPRGPERLPGALRLSSSICPAGLARRGRAGCGGWFGPYYWVQPPKRSHQGLSLLGMSKPPITADEPGLGGRMDDQPPPPPTPLLAALWDDDRAAALSLVAAGADPTAADSRDIGQAWTPLHFAAAVGDPELVRALVAAGADVDARSVAGQTRSGGPATTATWRRPGSCYRPGQTRTPGLPRGTVHSARCSAGTPR